MQQKPCDSYFSNLCINYLTTYQYDAALFFAERAYYELPTEENLQLISECYIRQNKYSQGYLILQNARSETNRYLLALCCIELKKYTEAETALLPGQYVPNGNFIPDSIVENIAGGVSGVLLLGKIAELTHRKSSAICYYQKCLQASFHELYLLLLLCF